MYSFLPIQDIFAREILDSAAIPLLKPKFLLKAVMSDARPSRQAPPQAHLKPVSCATATNPAIWAKGSRRRLPI